MLKERYRMTGWEGGRGGAVFSFVRKCRKTINLREKGMDEIDIL